MVFVLIGVTRGQPGVGHRSEKSNFLLGCALIFTTFRFSRGFKEKRLISAGLSSFPTVPTEHELASRSHRAQPQDSKDNFIRQTI